MTTLKEALQQIRDDNIRPKKVLQRYAGDVLKNLEKLNGNETEYYMDSYAKIRLNSYTEEHLLRHWQGELPSHVENKIINGWYRDHFHKIVEIFKCHTRHIHSIIIEKE